ncbi:MAG: malate dehydrogenase [Alphaproteobacteria bacterium]|nr:malate dehydrogenase [Alphaproteobacteria bacterium]
MNAPIRVAVTGAAGNIGYALLFRLASGGCYGPDQPIRLQLVEIPPGMKALEGVVMELLDGAFPLLHAIDIYDNPTDGFAGANQAFLVGARPRSAGMERADLIKANGPIFVGQGKALNDVAADDIRALVVGNPANTNALIALANAPDLPKDRIHAMTRLDENRAKAQLAVRAGVTPGDVTNMGIWGNHSSTMYPDFVHAKINGKPATEVITDHGWLRGDFIKTVATRGGAIIAARGASSAASAASAAIDHMASWWHGTAAGDWASMSVYSDGSHYGIPAGIVHSVPVTVKDQAISVVQGLAHDDFAKAKLKATADDLLSERVAIEDLLG